MTIDINIPAIPATALDLGTSETKSQLTIAFFFIGFAVGQAFYGPISDRFGRKPIILIGLAGYVLATIGCALSSSIEMLLTMRVLQGLTAACGPVLGRAVVRDRFSGPAMARVMSFVMAAFILAPIIAPSIGALILSFLHWRFIFVFLTVYALIIWLIVFFRFEETVDKLDPTATRLSRIIRSYPRFFAHKVSLCYGAVTVIFLSALVLYLSASSLIFMTGYGLSPSEFGLMFAAIAAFAGAASLINARLAVSIALTQIIFIALWMTLAGLGFGLFADLWGFGGALAMLPAFGLFFFGFNMIVTNSTALAMQPHSTGIGAMASVLGTFQSLVPAVISGLLAPLQDGTVLPTIIPMLLLTLLSMALAIAGQRYIK